MTEEKLSKAGDYVFPDYIDDLAFTIPMKYIPDVTGNPEIRKRVVEQGWSLNCLYDVEKSCARIYLSKPKEDL